uniref:Uncharacterized protein n=1 Tax=Nothobranchius furzeri TaxID=105023 RepID=A0A1A8AE76_NOTFU
MVTATRNITRTEIWTVLVLGCLQSLLRTFLPTQTQRVKTAALTDPDVFLLSIDETDVVLEQIHLQMFIQPGERSRKVENTQFLSGNKPVSIRRELGIRTSYS